MIKNEWTGWLGVFWSAWRHRMTSDITTISYPCKFRKRPLPLQPTTYRCVIPANHIRSRPRHVLILSIQKLIRRSSSAVAAGFDTSSSAETAAARRS